MRRLDGLTGSSGRQLRSELSGVLEAAGPPIHVPTHEDETIYVLDGHIEATCGDETLDGDPGATLFLPRGEPHTFRSTGGPATILFIVTPGHLDEFFAAKERIDAAGGDRSELAELVRRYL